MNDTLIGGMCVVVVWLCSLLSFLFVVILLAPRSSRLWSCSKATNKIQHCFL